MLMTWRQKMATTPLNRLRKQFSCKLRRQKPLYGKRIIGADGSFLRGVRHIRESKMRLRLLPSEYTPLSQTIFGLGGILLSFLNTQKTIDDIYELVREHYAEKGLTSEPSFESVTLAVNFLYL